MFWLQDLGRFGSAPSSRFIVWHIIILCAGLFPRPAVAQVLTPAAALTASSLTLRQAIDLALVHNRSLEKAGLDREVQRFDLRVANREFVPTLDFNAGVQRNPVTSAGSTVDTRTSEVNAAVSERIPTGGRFSLIWDSGFTDVSTVVPRTYDSGFFLQLDQPLLRGAGFATNLTALRIARISEKTNILEFKRNVIDTVTNVVFVYRNLLQAQRQAEVSETALARAREQLRVNRALVSSGILPPVEIIQTEADIATQEFNLLTAQSVRDSARYALLKLLDVDRTALFVAVDDIAMPEFSLDLEQCRALAFKHRPDYQQVLQGQQISELGAGYAKNGQLWALNFSTRYRVAGSDSTFASAFDHSFTRLNEDWNIGVTLQVPIGDLTRRQTYLHARAAAQKAAINVTELTENIEIEIRDALRTIDLSSRRVKVAKVARELAERKLEIERGKLQAGRTTNFAIVSFQNDLVSARLNEIGAQISYLNSLTALDQTLGITLEAWSIHIDDRRGDTGPAKAMATAP